VIQADIYSILSGSSVVTDLVSTRIYPIELPPKTAVPAIVYTVSDITPVTSLDGESGLDNGIVEIVCYSKSYMTAHLIAAAIRLAFVESGVGYLTEEMQDIHNEETRNYGVVMRLSAWSEANTNRGENMGQKVFLGDGVTTSFSLPKFRSGSLLIFFNGRLAKKGEESGLTGAYYEKSTLDGFVFRVAPKGGDYQDEILAFYAKAV
jgi:hypothetical protein